MKKNTLNSKFRFILLIVIFLIGSLYLLFNNFGLMKYMKLKNEVDSLSRELESIKLENDKLQSEIDSLKQMQPAKIEQIAREKHNMIKPTEKKIDVIFE